MHRRLELTPLRRLAEWLILVAAMAAIGIALAVDLWQGRRQAYAYEKDRLTVQARVIGENIGQQLEGIDKALLSIQSAARHTSPHQTPSEQLTTLSDSIAGMRNMLVLDRDAFVTASSDPAVLGRRFPDRDYFREPSRSRARDLLYVSPPFISVLGHPVIAVSRALFTPDGEFDGVVGASLDTRYLEVVVGAGLYADDMSVALAHGGGSVFLTMPAPVGAPLPQAGASAPAVPARLAALTPDEPGDEPARLSAVRRVSPPNVQMQYPLVVVTSRSKAAIHAPWRRQAAALGGFFAVLLAASAGGLHLGQSRRREVDLLEASATEERRLGEERLALALEGGAVGLWDWDMHADRMQLDTLTLETLGRRREDLGDAGPAWRALWHPEDAEVVMSAVARHAHAKSEAYEAEFRVRHQAGHWIWLGSRAKVVARDAAGVAVRMAGTHTNITERKRVETELQQLNERLILLSVTDPLTQIGNRRAFDQTLQSEWARAARRDEPVALLLIDVDHFKIYNDRYGHPAGDDCLRRIATLLREVGRREGELVARYGGEEFAVLIPGMTLADAQELAQRCIASLAVLQLPHPASPTSPCVTLSIGVVSAKAGPQSDASALVASADAALYRAKAAGRNRWMS